MVVSFWNLDIWNLPILMKWYLWCTDPFVSPSVVQPEPNSTVQMVLENKDKHVIQDDTFAQDDIVMQGVQDYESKENGMET